MVIIVGLGNEGVEYRNTFHNMGFMVLDKLAKSLGVNFTKEKYKAHIAETSYSGQKVLLAKPTTFMNNSGECVALLKNKFRDARILVVVDDIDLEKGALRYRERGSSGTHNGLRSIVSYIGEDFERLRVGVGRDKTMDLADYVLSKIKPEDIGLFDRTTDEACKKLLELISK